MTTTPVDLEPAPAPIGRTFPCRATIGTQRCDYRGTKTELVEHAAETGHTLCGICSRSLRNGEPRVCDFCIQHVRDDLHTIVETYDLLPSIVEHSGYVNTSLPGGVALVMLADGDVTGGGPDDWLSDPTPVIAVLEANERDWRITFGHGPAVDLASVQGCAGYLLTWLALAARTHPAFPEFAGEVGSLAVKLTHVTGVADDPVTAAANCFDCGGVLVSPYRSPLPDLTLRDRLIRRASQRDAEMSYGIEPSPVVDLLVHGGSDVEGREMVDDDPVWSCRSCLAAYDGPSYRLAVRAAVEAQAVRAG